MWKPLSLQNFLKALFPPKTPQTQPLQTFILEPILTPSGILDTGDGDSLDPLDLDLDDIIPTDTPETDDSDIDIIPFAPTETPEPFTSGYFTVDDTGQVTIDYLYDGGTYEGELAIFSLEGMEDYEPGSDEFILEAARRALAGDSQNSGHIVISDADEGARFNTFFDGHNSNRGEYNRPTTVEMQAGDRFAVMLVPKGSVQEMYTTLQNDGQLAHNMQPLFSLSTANPEDGMQMGQIADVLGDGHTFVMEDVRIDGRTDRDYNDMIFQIKGATGEAALLDDVIDPAKDWRETEVGQALITYAVFDPESDGVSIIDEVADTVKYAVERDSDITAYDPATLEETHNWVVGVSGLELEDSLFTLLEAENLGETGHLPHTYVWQFNSELNSAQIHQKLDGVSGIEFAYPLIHREHQSRSLLPDNTDLWHLHNTGQLGGTPEQDISAIPVWNTNYTGEGVTVAVVDDGLYYDHPDLNSSYRPDLSRDFYEGGGQNGFRLYDNDPSPFIGRSFGSVYSSTESHGTGVAGIIGGSNVNGAYGVAPDASLVGLRLVPNTLFALGSDAVVNDLKEADSLFYLQNDIDIYNNSWGPGEGPNPPNDLEGPQALTEMVLITGVNQGRNGLGNIYVWSAGNQGHNQQNVNYDGYANSRYTIAVAAVDHHGKQASYSEPGAPLLVSAYSGSDGTPGIKTATADPSPSQAYTNNFSGTSAAAAVTSGVVALMLEANPNLTWRDVQHILVETALKNDENDSGWTKNGAGHEINYKYGFGVVDAEAAVEKALEWQQIGTEVMLTSGEREVNEPILNDGTTLADSFTFTEDITVESVEVMFDADHKLRGDLEVVLISPDGTESVLAESHTDVNDLDGSGEPTGIDQYRSWIFTSMRHWGESSRGEWKLQVRDEKGNDVQGDWKKWKLNLYGTKPMIAVEATDPEAREGEDEGEFTIRRRGNTKFPVTVNYDVIGAYHGWEPKATPDEDYEALPGSITIPAGASEVKIPVRSLEDNESEFPETVRIQISQNAEYEVSPNQIDAVLIQDNDLPTLRLFAEWWTGQPKNNHRASYTSESGNEGHFVLRRRGDRSYDLPVYFDLPGTATPGVDYKILSYNRQQEFTNSFVFPAGQRDFWFRFVPIDDSSEEGDKTVDFTLTPDPTYGFYVSGRIWDRTPITLADNDDRPTVSITTMQDPILEEGTPGRFTFTRTGDDLSEPLEVEYWISTGIHAGAFQYPATNGEDYQEIPESIVIPAGETSVTLDIQTKADNEIEPIENLRIFLKSNPAYAISSQEQATLYISDPNHQPPQTTWVRQLGTATADKATGIAVDAAGNAYITGRTAANIFSQDLEGLFDSSQAQSKNSDYDRVGDVFVAKYNPQGQRVWQEQLGTQGFEEATGIVVDDAGNTYIAGSTDGITGDGKKDALSNHDVWLVKYDAAGNRQWTRSLGQQANASKNQLGYDVSKGGMSIDPNGNIYLTGYTFSNLNGSNAGSADAFVSKYAPNGDLVWTRQLGTDTWDEASGVVADSQGNVYITGHTKGQLPSQPQAGDKDVWVAKYDVSGNQQWVQQFGTATADEALGIAIDEAAGQVYLTGKTNDRLGETYGGSWLDWLGDYNEREKARLGDRTGLGGTYAGEGDAWLAAVDTDGNIQWKRLLGTNAADSASSVKVDDKGNVFVTGRTAGKIGAKQVSNSDVTGTVHLGGEDMFVAKYDPAGALLWKQQLGTTADEGANAMALSGSSVYLAGVTTGAFGAASGGGEDAWIARLG